MSSRKLVSLGWLLALLTITASAQSAAFTYQGRLQDNGAAANGAYDLQFALFNAASGGAQQGATITRNDVAVTDGVFTVQLDFGATPFNGAARWLHISVRNGASTGAYTPLNPRQALAPTPYALRSLSATSADSLSPNCVGCITATQIQGGSNFIQNATTPQANANFNISGNGVIGGSLSLNGASGAGFPLSVQGVGSNGEWLGFRNTGGATKWHLNHLGGGLNIAETGQGDGRLFLAPGGQVGIGVTTPTARLDVNGNINARDSINAQSSINTRYYTIDGRRALSVPRHISNLSVGVEAGQSDATSDGNTFVGFRAGQVNTIGDDNTFVGAYAGDSNTTGRANTLLGGGADVTGPDLEYATAIGAFARVSTSNTIVLGRDGGQDKVRLAGLGAAGSAHLYRNVNNEIAHCSSSLRYKTDLAPYRHGLDFIRRLQPISFIWKAGGQRDLGFGAEDVAKVDPLLVIHNAQGEVEGVKYDRLSALLVNAVKEQQAHIEAQQQAIAALQASQAENAELKAQLAALRARQARQEAQLAALAARLAPPKAAGQR